MYAALGPFLRKKGKVKYFKCINMMVKYLNWIEQASSDCCPPHVFNSQPLCHVYSNFISWQAFIIYHSIKVITGFTVKMD